MSPDALQSAVEATFRLPELAEHPIPQLDLDELKRLSLWNSISKQERDYVVAAFVLRGRYLTERVLRNAIRNWTPFGIISLEQNLKNRGLLKDETLETIRGEAEQYFESLAQAPSWKSMPHTTARRTSSLLERLDPTGRVAKLFGLSNLPRAVVGNEFRACRARFRLLRKIGQGGLGTVWLALDTSLNRYVAVKEIIGSPDRQSAAVARFRREAEITGRLDHPGIVPVHMLAEDENGGRLFYVMRFLGNTTLEDAIRDYHERREAGQSQPMDFHQLLTAFVSVCQAIAYAHANRVMHHDLKPQNVALDSFGQVIVLDWGLAKSLNMDDPQSFSPTATDDRAPDRLDVTVAGQVTGTPMYMAPEQAAGRLDEIDERTDVYGLGAILFCILTGYAPHEVSQESLAAGMGMAHLLDRIIDGPASSARRLNSSVPAALEAICQKAMAADRHARYASAAALAEDVQRFMADEPISVYPESQIRRLRRWASAHSRLSRLLGGLAIAAVIFGSVTGLSSYQYSMLSNQVRLENAAQEIRTLKEKLSYELESLNEHTRLIARLPAIEGLLDLRGKPNDSARQAVEDRLKRVFQRFLEVKPSYLAMSCWVNQDAGPRSTVRAERKDTSEESLQVDFTEFFGRHLPAIAQLTEGDIYLGMPGRLAKDVEGHSEVTRKAIEKSTEAVGKTLVAGAVLFAGSAKERVGGVLIECDLERILREYLFTASPETAEIDLTDSSGRPVMRFTREKGLFAIDPAATDGRHAAALRRFFASEGSADVYVVSPGLTAAKVPLNRHQSGDYMGLIVRSRPGRIRSE